MIKLIPLKIGVNLISELVAETDTQITLKKPAVIYMQQQNGQIMIGFSPFLEYAMEFESGITLNKSDVLSVLTPNTEMLNEYNKHFGSGIQIASADVLSMKK
jgi:hypothetical protein